MRLTDATDATDAASRAGDDHCFPCKRISVTSPDIPGSASYRLQSDAIGPVLKVV